MKNNQNNFFFKSFDKILGLVKKVNEVTLDNKLNRYYINRYKIIKTVYFNS